MNEAKKDIPSYSRLLGEYTGTLEGLLTVYHYDFPNDVKENLTRKLAELKAITHEDIVAKEVPISTLIPVESDDTRKLLQDIISWEKDLSEYDSLESILRERYKITKR